MRARGFSLIETILATFVLSLITMAVFNIFPSSVMAVKRGEMELEADSLAQQLLEEYRSKPFETLTLGPGPALPPVSVAGTTFEVQARVNSVVGSDANHLKAVEVTVDWTHSAKSHRIIREAWIVSVEN